MRKTTPVIGGGIHLSLLAALICYFAPERVFASALQEQNAKLLDKIISTHNYPEADLTKLKGVFDSAGYMGQGNPAVTKHPVTTNQCQEKLKQDGISYQIPNAEKICGAKFMAPLYNPDKEKPEDAVACIDQFEFPNIPCEYPVVWTRAIEAVKACQAIGKRLCDAHEWESACAGELTPPEYDYDLAKKMGEADAFRAMRSNHNRKHSTNKKWAYGPNFQKEVCGQNSSKDDGCNGGDWQKCGSNTYPSGYFPKCTSRLQVFDIHGNAAEHMNLPVKPEQRANHSSQTYGHTEMKGSWFIWDKFQAHEDWCRWRAPYWHGSKVMDEKSHHNYHLSFRCCKDVK